MMGELGGDCLKQVLLKAGLTVLDIIAHANPLHVMFNYGIHALYTMAGLATWGYRQHPTHMVIGQFDAQMCPSTGLLGLRTSPI